MKSRSISVGLERTLQAVVATLSILIIWFVIDGTAHTQAGTATSSQAAPAQSRHPG